MRFLIAAHAMVYLLIISMSLIIYVYWPLPPTAVIQPVLSIETKLYPDIALDMTKIPSPPKLIFMKYGKKKLTQDYYRKLNYVKKTK